MDLQGKVAVITGAASGLGLATCKELLSSGARVIAADLNADALKTAVEPLGSKVRAVGLDVADEGAIASAVGEMVEIEGAIHILVNCAGILGPSKMISHGQPFPVDVWDQVLAINLSGTFHMIRHCVLVMAKNIPDNNKERGVIVNTASVAAWQGQRGQAAYSATKAAVIGMTLPIARDLAEYGIRIISIAPGLFQTGMAASVPKKVYQGLIDEALFPDRPGNPEEFGSLVRHIVNNTFLNATTIDLDAGMRIGTRY